MNNPIPPRIWRKDGVFYVAHAASGALVALGIIWGGPVRVLALAWLATRLVYQWLEFERRGDTPGRDVGDISIGFGAMVAGALALVAWHGRKQGQE